MPKKKIFYNVRKSADMKYIDSANINSKPDTNIDCCVGCTDIES